MTVVGVKLTKSSGLVLTGWGSRPNPFHVGGHMFGDGPVSATKAGFLAGPATITNRCGDENATVDREFAVELHRTSAATGWVEGLTVSYRPDGSRNVRNSQWLRRIVLCGNTVPPTRNLSTLC